MTPTRMSHVSTGSAADDAGLVVWLTRTIQIYIKDCICVFFVLLLVFHFFVLTTKKYLCPTIQ